MKRLMITLTLVVTVGLSSAQEKEAVPEGTPAVLEAVNGKKIRVFLRGAEDGSVTFLPYKADSEITVGAEQIASLEFFPMFDAETVEAAFKNGEFELFLETLETPMVNYAPYMAIQNNLQDVFGQLRTVYLKVKNYEKVRECADLLLQSGDADLIEQSRVDLALTALAKSDLNEARAQQEKVKSEAAGLYLEACIQRVSGQPEEAMKIVIDMIAKHANAVDWLAPAELLGAHIYMDLGHTNSAVATARQVKNMYAGTVVSADAEAMQKKVQETLDQLAESTESSE